MLLTCTHMSLCTHTYTHTHHKFEVQWPQFSFKLSRSRAYGTDDDTTRSLSGRGPQVTNLQSIMQQLRVWLVALVITGAAIQAGASDPCYDHQKLNYSAQFEPTACAATCTVTPFFSPDTSVEAYVALIESATASIDIFTPG